MRENEERWRELCELAIKEQDPHKFLELILEVNRLLGVKEQRLIDERKTNIPSDTRHDPLD